MLITTIFFMSFSLIVSAGLITPIVKQLKVSSNLWKSTESYYTAEAGIEDVTYRVKSGKEYNTTEVLTIGDFSAETTLENTLDGITITSTGSSGNYQKSIETKVVEGEGISFVYGIQSGKGGILFGSSAGVIGNVYSNGDIISQNSGAFITGSAYVANSPDIVADQANESPSIPTNSIVFGNANISQDFAQSFEVSTSSTITQINLFVKQTGSPSNATVNIIKDSGGNPSSDSDDILASGILNSSLVTESFGWVEIPLSPNPTISSSTAYWIVIDASTGSDSKKYTIGANLDSNYLNGLSKTGRGNSWNSPTGYDAYFKVYLGGAFGKIIGMGEWNKFDIGTEGVGNVHAHTVNYVNASGFIRCKSDYKNNKVCDTSYDDPTPAPFPVSDGNVEDWKDIASRGGTFVGNYGTLGYGTSTLPYGKIVGDLTISGGHILTLNKMLWVTGNIIMEGNSRLLVSQSFGNSGLIIVTDGRVAIPGSCRADGNGNSGSYLMIVTTSNCSGGTTCGGKYAMEISGSGGAVILNAQKGTIYFVGSASAKEATADRIVLAGGGVRITYESGLANPNFVDGPSGGFNITSWKEIE